MSETRTTQILELNARSKVVNVTGAGAVAYTLKPGAKFRLKEIRVHLSAAGGAGNLTATVDAAAGAAYDAVVYSQDMASVTDLFYQPTFPIQFEAADEVDFAWPNASSRTYGLSVYYDLL